MGPSEKYQEHPSLDLLSRELAELRDTVQGRIARLELVVNQARGAREDLRATVETLEAQLKEKEEGFRLREAAVRELQEGVKSKIRDLETRLHEKERLLADRDRELKELKSKNQSLVHRIGRMEAFIKQARAWVLAETSDASDAGSFSPPQEAEEKVEQPQKLDEGHAPAPMPPLSVPIASPQIIDRMIRLLIESMGPMGALVIKDQIHALGESFTAFPKARLIELVQALSGEILDESLRAKFRKLMAAEIEKELEPQGPNPGRTQRRDAPVSGGSGREERHEFLAASIRDLDRQVKEKEHLLKIREAQLRELTSSISGPANADPRAHVQDKTQNLKNRLAEEELRKLKDELSAELDRLRAELHEKRVQMAQIEREEWRSGGSAKTGKKGLLDRLV